jgi:YggT family protein
MNPQVAAIVTFFLWFLVIAVIARALLSWFPQGQNSQVARLLNQLTEPIIEPVRNLMPKTGIIDFSTLIVIVVLQIMIRVVAQASN